MSQGTESSAAELLLRLTSLLRSDEEPDGPEDFPAQDLGSAVDEPDDQVEEPAHPAPDPDLSDPRFVAEVLAALPAEHLSLDRELAAEATGYAALGRILLDVWEWVAVSEGGAEHARATGRELVSRVLDELSTSDPVWSTWSRQLDLLLLPTELYGALRLPGDEDLVTRLEGYREQVIRHHPDRDFAVIVHARAMVDEIFRQADRFGDLEALRAQRVELRAMLENHFGARREELSAAVQLAWVQGAWEAVDEAAAFGARPEFSLELLDGRTVTMDDFAGKAVLLELWATWCHPCVEMTPDLLRVYQQYSGSGFEILGIAVDDDRTRIEAYAQKKGITWPMASVPWDSELPTALRLNGVPHLVLVSRDGRVRPGPQRFGRGNTRGFVAALSAAIDAAMTAVE